MNAANDPLAQLRGLHLPAEIGWWPPAAGWWLLTLLIVVLVASAVMLWRRGIQRREALAELAAIEDSDLQGPGFAQALNLLLRRYAMACYAQQNPAALTGRAWLEFLARNRSPRDLASDVFIDIAQPLVAAAFAPAAQFDRLALLKLARQWIKHNRKTQLQLRGAQR